MVLGWGDGREWSCARCDPQVHISVHRGKGHLQGPTVGEGDGTGQGLGGSLFVQPRGHLRRNICQVRTCIYE